MTDSADATETGVNDRMNRAMSSRAIAVLLDRARILAILNLLKICSQDGLAGVRDQIVDEVVQHGDGNGIGHVFQQSVSQVVGNHQHTTLAVAELYRMDRGMAHPTCDLAPQEI